MDAINAKELCRAIQDILIRNGAYSYPVKDMEDMGVILVTTIKSKSGVTTSCFGPIESVEFKNNTILLKQTWRD